MVTLVRVIHDYTTSIAKLGHEKQQIASIQDEDIRNQLADGQTQLISYTEC
jgi:hypothetical protein